MGPRQEDMISTGLTLPMHETKTNRRGSFRMTPRSLIGKVWPRGSRSDKPRKSRSKKRSLKHKRAPESPQSEQPTSEISIERTSLDDENEPTAVPMEVTVIEEYANPRAHSFYTSGGPDERLEVAQAESEEYLLQLHNAQGLVDQLTRDLNKSRSQVAELIDQNTTLLNELKAVAGKDEASLSVHRMMREELNMLKGSLFFVTLFVFCGGRPDLLALIGLVWFVADISA